MMRFAIGEKVQLVSGGLAMTVIARNDERTRVDSSEERARVAFWSKHRYIEREFPTICLRLYVKP